MPSDELYTPEGLGNDLDRHSRTDPLGGMTLWSQMDAETIDVALVELHNRTTRLDVAKTHAVYQARKLGLSWAQIGDALGMTKQAAWERWSLRGEADDDA